MNLGKTLRESLSIKEGSDRSNYISELRDLGCNYNFDKYSDQQLYCIWKKAKAKKEKDFDALEAESSEEIKTCPKCGSPLNDGGTCPKCDDGEEDESLDEAKESASTASTGANTTEIGMKDLEEFRQGRSFLVIDEFKNHAFITPKYFRAQKRNYFSVAAAKGLVRDWQLLLDDKYSNWDTRFFVYDASTKNLKEDKIEHLDISNNKDPNFNRKIKDLSFPVDVIPNNMGINLSSVKNVNITKQNDGQIKNVDINFISDKTKANAVKSILNCGLFSFTKNNKGQPENNTKKLIVKGTKEELEKKKKELERSNPKLFYKVDLLKKDKVEYRESLDLTEKIEKHDALNPALWDGEELKPEVKGKFLKIVKAFKDCLKEDGVELKDKDVVIIGSNASYNYTDQSDIDLHIIADTKDKKDTLNLLPIIFNSYKSRFNDKHDINIKGHEVEVYVEPNDINAKSNGIYSLNTGWIKKPVKEDIPDMDEKAFDKLFTEWEDKYFDLLSKVGEDNSNNGQCKR